MGCVRLRKLDTSCVEVTYSARYNSVGDSVQSVLDCLADLTAQIATMRFAGSCHRPICAVERPPFGLVHGPKLRGMRASMRRLCRLVGEGMRSHEGADATEDGVIPSVRLVGDDACHGVCRCVVGDRGGQEGGEGLH
jgi:hypothetical protein